MTPEEDPRSGKGGEASPGGCRLAQPAVQVFEKKAEPEATAVPGPEPKAPESAPAPPAAPAMGRPTLSLKRRS